MSGSPNSDSLRSIKANIIAWAISSLQEPTNIRPNAIAVNAITSSGAFASPSTGINLARICQNQAKIYNNYTCLEPNELSEENVTGSF